MALPINGNHAASSEIRDNGVISDVGVVIPGSGIMASVGLALLVNLSAGGIVGDWAGCGGAMLSMGGSHSANSPLRMNGVVVLVGVAIPGLGMIGTAGPALVVNLLAGSIVNDSTGTGVCVSFNGNPASVNPNRDNGVTANVGVAMSGSGNGSAIGFTIGIYSASGSAVNEVML